MELLKFIWKVTKYSPVTMTLHFACYTAATYCIFSKQNASMVWMFLLGGMLLFERATHDLLLDDTHKVMDSMKDVMKQQQDLIEKLVLQNAGSKDANHTYC